MNFKDWIRTALTSLAPRDGSPGNRYVREHLFADPDVMRLEPREVLSGDGVTSELIVDTGGSADDGSADQIDVHFSRDQIEVSVNGDVSLRSALDGINSIVLRGSSDQDQFRIHAPLGLPRGSDVLIDGRDGSRDSLVFDQLERIESLIHSLDQPGQGNIRWSTGDIEGGFRYAGIEHVIHTAPMDTFELRAGEGINDVTVSDLFNSDQQLRVSAIGSVDAVAAETYIDFVVPKDRLQIDVSPSETPDSGGRLTLEGWDSAFDADVFLRGDADDEVIVRGTTDLRTGSFWVDAGRIAIEGTVRVDASTIDLRGSTSVEVLATGRLNADFGTVTIIGGSVNADGYIRALGGDVLLESGPHAAARIDGVIDVSDRTIGGLGGSVRLLGAEVELLGGAAIDASGHSAGGSVLIGGDYQGRNPELRNARRTSVASTAVVSARATHAGDGGRVIVWADDTTLFYGSIDARGGDLNGAGGFAEVSGKRLLDFTGSVDLTAPNGDSGTLLLDPDHIRIVTPGNDAIADADEYSDPGNTSRISAATLVAALDTANVELLAHATITVEEAIDATGNTNSFDLTLRAGQSISIGENVLLRGNFFATANDNSGDAAKRDDGAGDFTMDDGVMIDTSAVDGNISITVANGFSSADDFSGSITLERLDAGSGDVTITNSGAADGSSILRDTDATTAASIVGQTVIFSVTDTVTNLNGSVGSAAASMQITAATLIAESQNGGVFVEDTGGLTLSNIDAGTGGIHIQSSGTIQVSDLDASGIGVGEGSVVLSASTGNITLNDNAIVAGAGGVALSATAGQIVETTASTTNKISSSGHLHLISSGGVGGAAADAEIDISVTGLSASATTSGDIHINETDDVIVTGLTTQAGAISLTSGGGLTDVTGAIDARGAAASSGAVTISAVNLSLANSLLGSAIGITATGSLNLSGTSTVTADGSGTTLNLVADSITLAAGTLGDEAIRHAGDGDIVMAIENGNIALKDHGIKAANGDVTLTTVSGAIVEADVSTAIKIDASGSLTLSADTGVGSTSGDEAIDLSVGSLAARNTTSGSIAIVETNDLTISTGNGVAGITAGSGGDVVIASGGALTIDGGQRIVAGGSGTQVDLQAAGISIGSGSASLPTVQNTGTGTIVIQSSGGNIVLGDHALSAQSGAVTVDAGTSNVTITGTTSTAEVVTTGTLTVTGAAIGATNTLHLQGVTVLTVNDSGSGAINVAERSTSSITRTTLNVGDIGFGAIQIDYQDADVINVGDNHAITTVTHQNSNRAFEYFAGSGNITLGQIDSGSADVVIATTSGSITEATPTSVTTITANNLTLSSTTGIGSAATDASIDLAVVTLAARSTISGGIYLTEVDGVTVQPGALGVTGLQADADVSLVSGGNITLNDGAITAGGGNVSVNAGGNNLIVNGILVNATIATTGALSLTAATIGTGVSPLEVEGASSLIISDTGSGAIHIAELNTASIAETTITVGATGFGTIDIDYFGTDSIDINDGHQLNRIDHSSANRSFRYTASSGDIELPDAAIDAGSGMISLSATTGHIDEASASTLNKITTTGALLLSAGTSIGSSSGVGALDIDVATLAAQAGSGGVFIENFGTLVIGTVDSVSGVTSSGGNIQIDTNGGNLTVNQTVAASPGNVDLSGNDLSINADIVGQNLTIVASGTFDLSAANALTAGGTGTMLSVSATTLDIRDGSLNSETIRNAGSGQISLSATSGDISLGDHAVASDTGNVALYSAGSITESTASNSVNIRTSGSLVLDASGSIGATGGLGIAGSGPLDIATSSLTAHSSTSGGVFLKNTGTVSLTDVDTVAGDIQIAASAGVSVLDIDAGGAVTIVADSNDILLASDGINASDDVALDAVAGAVTETPNDPSTKITTSGFVTLSSATGVGSTGSGGSIEIIAVGLAADSTAFGNVSVAYSNDLVIGAGYNGINGVSSASGFQLNRLSGSGQLLISESVTAIGNVVLHAVDVDAGATVSGANVTINVPGEIDVASGSRIIGGGDGTTVSLIADTIQLGAGSLHNETITNSGSGTVTITANIAQVLLPSHAIAGGTGTVEITAGGIIDEVSDDDVSNVRSSGLLMLSAVGGIGASGGSGINGNGPLDIGAASLTATNAGSGGIFIKDVGGLIVNQATALNGGVEVRSSGTLQAINIDAGGAVTLRATAGNLTLADNAVTSSAGNILIAADAGSILEASVNTVTKIQTSGVIELTASGNIGGVGANEAIDLNSPTLAASSTGGGVFVTSVGDLIVAGGPNGVSGITGNGGDVFVDVTGSLTINAPSRIVGGGNGTSITILANTISLQAGGSGNETVRNTGSGNVALTAASGDIVLPDHAIRTDSGVVSLNASTGSIVEAVANATTSITTSGALSFVSSVAIGSASLDGAIDTAVGTLAASTGSGGIFVRDADGLQIDTVGSIVGVDTSGDLVLESAGGNFVINERLRSTAGDVTLTGGTFLVSANVEGRFVTVTASGDVTLSGGAQFSAGGTGTTLSITAASMALGSGTVGNEALRNAGSGNVSLTITSGDIQLLQYAIGSDSGFVTVNATAGAITNPIATTSPQIRTNGVVTLISNTGIGSSVAPIMTSAGTLAARTVTSGGIFIGDSDDVVIGIGVSGASGLTTAAGGAIRLVSASGITRVDHVITAGTGSVTLDTGTLDINADVQGSTLDLDATGSVDIASGAQLLGGGTSTDITVDASVIQIGSGGAFAETIKNTGGGTVAMTTTGGNITLRDFAVGSGSGQITLNAGTGNLIVANTSIAPEVVSSGDLRITAAAIGGVTNPLRLDGVSRLFLTDTGGGDVSVQETGAATITATDITVGTIGFGAIAVDYFDADRIDIQNNHVITSVRHFSSNRHFSYRANAGDITISDQAILAGSADVAIRADSGSIDEATSGTTAKIETTGSLSMRAGGDIGSGSNTAALDVSVAFVAAQSTGGSLYLRSINGVTVSGGTLGFDGLITAGGEIDVSVVSGTLLVNRAIQAGGGRVDLNATSINLAGDVSGGNVTATASNDVTVINGHRVVGGGDSTAVTLQGGTISIGVGSASNASVQNSGTGTIDVTASAGPVTLSNHSIRNDSGSITIDAGTHQIAVIQPTATPEIRSSGSVALTAGSIGTTTNPLDIQGATAVSLTDAGLGDMYLREVFFNSIASVAVTVQDTSFGTIDFQYNNADRLDIDGAHQLTSIDHSGFNRSFSYFTTVGNLSVGVIDTGSGDVSLITLDGNINESTPDPAVEITTSGVLTLSSTSGIGGSGAGQALDIEAGVLAASTITGGVFIDESSGIIVGTGVGGVAGITALIGSIVLDANASDITVDQAITTSLGDVQLVGNTIDINADVRGFNIDINANGSLDIQSGSQIVAGGAGTTLFIESAGAVVGAGSFGNDTIKNSSTGTVSLITADADVTLGRYAIGGGTGSVAVSVGTGTIAVASSTTEPEISAAGGLSLTASTIGSASNVLGIQAVNSLTLVDTGAGDISLAEVAGNSIANVAVTVGADGFGDIDIDYSNADLIAVGSGHLIQQVQHAGGNRAFSYTANSGNIQLGGAINTGLSGVTLNALGGSINESVANANTKINTASTLTLSAATGIGASAPDAAIDVQAGTIAAQTTVSGGIYLNEIDGTLVGVGEGGVSGIIAASGGDVSLTVLGNTVLQSDLSGNNVDLNSAGVVTVANGNRITAGGNTTTLTLSAAGIDLALGSVGNETIFNSGTGTIHLESTAANINIRNYSIATGSGTITLDAQSNGIDVTNLFIAPHVTTGGDVAITASSVGSAGNPLNVAGASGFDIIDTGAGDIYVTEFATVTVASTVITVGGAGYGAIDVGYANADRIAIADSHQISTVAHATGNRGFRYTANSGDVRIDDFAINTGSADVIIRSDAGSIIDNGGSLAPNLASSGTVTLLAAGNIGSAAFGSAIDLDANTLAAQSTGTGGIYLVVADSATIGTGADSVSGVTTTVGGDIQVTAANTLLLSQAVVSNDGNTTLSATTLDIDADVRGTDVDLDASASLDVASGARVVAGGDGSVLTLDAGKINLHAGSAADPTVQNSGTGTVWITSWGQSISLDPNSIGGGTGLVAVNAGFQQIEVPIPTGTAEIRTSGLVALTVSGIGSSTNALEIAGATSLQINDTGSGDIFVSESAGVSIGAVELNVGNLGHDAIDIVFFGTDVLQVDDQHLLRLIDLSNGNRSLNYNAGLGDVAVGSIQTGSGSLTVTAPTGSILDAPVNVSTDIFASGPVILTAAGNIGTSSQPLATQVQNLSAVTTFIGGVSIREVDGLVIGTGGSVGVASSGGGAIDILSTSGTITVAQSVLAGSGNVTLDSENVTVQAPVLGGNITLNASNSLNIDNQRVIAGGDGTLLSITAPQLNLASGAAGAETLTNSGTGGIIVTATTGDVNLGDHAIGGGGGILVVQAPNGSILESNVNSVAKINASGLLQLDASGAIGMSSFGGTVSNNPLDVSVGSLVARSFGNGDVSIRDADGVALLGVLTANGNIDLASVGTVTVVQPVNAGNGNVSIDANRISLFDDGDVTALSGNILLSTTQADGLAFNNGAVLTTGQGRISGQLLNAPNPFAGSANVGSPLTDSNREATINVVLADPLAANLDIEIDWSEGDRILPVPVVPPQNLRARFVAAEIAMGGVGGTFSHIYEEPPDPTNPSADINIGLRLLEIASGTIQLQMAGQSVLTFGKFVTQSLRIDVSAPILPFFVALPQVGTIEQFVMPPTVVSQTLAPERILVLETPQQFTNSIGTGQHSDSRYYVLRIVSFGDEGEVRLDQQGQEYRLRNLDDPDSETGFELSQLPELFKRLPDDRYRIYMIDGQTERLVLDFIIRDGQPVEAQQETAGAESDAVRSNEEEATEADPGPVADDLSSRPSGESLSRNLATRLGDDAVISSGGILLSASMLPLAARSKRHAPTKLADHHRPTVQ